jgi:hypothetical protein
MIKKMILLMISAFLAITFSLIIKTPIFAAVGVKIANLAKTTVFVYEQFDANSIACWLSNKGSVVSFGVTGTAGMEWPKGSNKTLDFASGLWLAGKTPDSEIRSVAAEYSTEFRPGFILPNGIVADLNDPAFSRLYVHF